jgi:hypothetical protein
MGADVGRLVENSSEGALMARTKAARHRRRRRFTPRRWLPFVALSALVAGATVIEPGTPSLAPERVDASLDVARLPSVAAADAISTAWYCAGGTAAGDEGAAELSLVVANHDDTGSTAEVTLHGPDGEVGATTLDVPANGRARLTASDLGEAEWVGATVEARGGRVAVDREVRGPLGFDASPCATEAADRWYVPSGSTVRGARLVLSFYNPFPDAASVDVALATDSGIRRPRDLRRLSVPARSVRTVAVDEIVTNRATLAASISVASGRVVVDRVQSYDGTGDPLVDALAEESWVASVAPQGLVSTTAVPVRADRWVFPSARVSEGVRTQIAVHNPGSRPAEVDVAVAYQEPERNPELEPLQLTIPPRQQVVVDLADVADLLPDTDLWVDVRSLEGVPVVAERLSFYGEAAARQGAAVTLGSPVAATRWLVTQAGSTRQRTATVQVVNPGPAPAQVTVEQLSDSARSPLPSAAITLAPGDRQAISLEGSGAAASIVVLSDVPVVVASSISLLGAPGIGLAPAFPFPDALAELPPWSS